MRRVIVCAGTVLVLLVGLALPAQSASAASLHPRTVTYAYTKLIDNVPHTFIASIRVDSGRRTTLFEGNSPSWSRDGKTFAFIAPTGDITVQRNGGPRVDTGVATPYLSTISLSPDGTRIAFNATTGAGFIWIMNATAPYDPHPTVLEGGQPSWSPDGTMLAFVDVLSFIEASSLDGSVQIQASADDRSAAPAWSPDGQYIAYVDEHRDVRAVFLLSTATGGIVRELYPAVVGSNLAWSPDSTQLALNAAPHPWGLNQLIVITLDGTKIRDFPRIPVTSVAWQPTNAFALTP